MHKAKEDLLVIAAQQGNEQAFTFLCKHYHTSLLRFAYKISSDQQIAHDGVQNAWIKLSKNLRALQDPRAFKSWIFKTVRWCVFDLMRQSMRDQAVFETNVAVEYAPQPEFVESKQSEILKVLIDELPAIDKQVIHLFYLEEMKIKEIAEVLQVATGTIKSRLNRARNTLQSQFDNQKER